MSLETPIIVFILAVLVYLLSKWILKKFRLGNDKNRNFLAILSAIIISPVLYIGVIIIWFFSISYYPNIDFNKHEWESNIEERYKMSKDIIQSELLIGKTKDEVVELLGNDYYKYDDNRIAYHLGFVPGFSIDPDVLDIFFENGIVIKVEQHET